MSEYILKLEKLVPVSRDLLDTALNLHRECTRALDSRDEDVHHGAVIALAILTQHLKDGLNKLSDIGEKNDRTDEKRDGQDATDSGVKPERSDGSAQEAKAD